MTPPSYPQFEALEVSREVGAIQVLQDNLFGKRYSQVMGKHGLQFALLLALCEQARIAVLKRPEVADSVNDLIRCLDVDWASL